MAVLAVIGYHADKTWVPGGFVGVDIFLVISGYLISSLILRARKNGTFKFRKFFGARVRRIVPAYLVLLSVAAFVMALVLTPQDFAGFTSSLKSAFYFGSNTFFARQADYFAPESYELPLLHTWSLAVEMQFYLLLPFLLIYLPKRVLGPLLITLVIALTAYATVRLHQGERQAIYFSLWARIPEFLLGCLVAIYEIGENWSPRVRQTSAFLGLALILVSVFAISEGDAFPGVLSLAPSLGAALLVAARRSVVSHVLSLGPLVVVGTLSYSLYLWHWPVLASIRYGSEVYFLSPLLWVCFIVLTITGTLLSYHYVEQPFRVQRQGRRRYVPMALLAAFSLLLIAVAGPLSAKLVPALEASYTRYAAPSSICHGEIVGDCIRGDHKSKKQLLLMGDSHAAQLNHFADVVGQGVGTQVRVLSASSCVTIGGFDVARIREWARKPCLDQIKKTQGYFSSTDGIILAGFWSYHYKSEPFKAALDAFFRQMKSNKKAVLVLAQTPMLTSNVQRMYRLNQLGVDRLASIDSEFGLANEAIRSIAARHSNVRFLDFSKSQIFSHAPFSGNQLIYMDKVHLNEIGSALYGKAATASIGDWMSRLD